MKLTIKTVLGEDTAFDVEYVRFEDQSISFLPIGDISEICVPISIIWTFKVSSLT